MLPKSVPTGGCRVFLEGQILDIPSLSPCRWTNPLELHGGMEAVRLRNLQVPLGTNPPQVTQSTRLPPERRRILGRRPRRVGLNDRLDAVAAKQGRIDEKNRDGRTKSHFISASLQCTKTLPGVHPPKVLKPFHSCELLGRDPSSAVAIHLLSRSIE